MRNLLYLIIMLGVFSSCKKKTELEYTDRLLDIRFSVESDCDTTYIDSLRYLNADLDWVTVVEPRLPWSMDQTYYDLDTMALEVFGYAGNYQQASVLNAVWIRINGSLYKDTQGSGTSESVFADERVEPYLDTLIFRRLVGLKVD